MDGPHHALWDMLATVWHGSLACSETSGGLTRDVAENAAECPQAFPAGSKRDFRDRLIGVTEQRDGSLDPACEQISVRRNAKGLFEGAREMCLRNSAHLRQSVDGPFLLGGSIDSIFRSQQASQQFRTHRAPQDGELEIPAPCTWH